jgi:hypothetical protein
MAEQSDQTFREKGGNTTNGAHTSLKIQPSGRMRYFDKREVARQIWGRGRPAGLVDTHGVPHSAK